MEPILETGIRYYGYTEENIEKGDEEVKNCLTAYITYHVSNNKYFFKLLDDICELCGVNPNYNDFSTLVTDCDIIRIIGVLEYIRNNHTNYKDTDILKCLCKYAQLEEIHYIYERYFLFSNIKKEVLLQFAGKKIQPLAVFIFCGGIDLEDIPKESKGKVINLCSKERAR